MSENLIEERQNGYFFLRTACEHIKSSQPDTTPKRRVRIVETDANIVVGFKLCWVETHNHQTKKFDRLCEECNDEAIQWPLLHFPYGVVLCHLWDLGHWIASPRLAKTGFRG